MTISPKAHRVTTHNKMRDVVAAIYRSLHVHVTVKVQGLYAQFSSCREHKPGETLAPAPALGPDKTTGLYIPTIIKNDTAVDRGMDRGSDRKPLVAAAVRHDVKLGTHKRGRGERSHFHEEAPGL